VQIEEMHRVCGLSEQQMKRLQVAAKGAVDRSMDKYRDQFKQLQDQFGGAAWGIELEGNLDEPDAENEVVDDKPAEERAVEAAKAGIEVEAVADENDVLAAAAAGPVALGHIAFVDAGGFADPFAVDPFGGGAEANAPAREALWKKTVEKTLNPEQRRAYEKAQLERSQFYRDATMQQLIARIDRQLLLSDQQRLQLRKLIDETAGRQAERRAVQGVEFAEMHMMNQLFRIPKAKLRQFLSPAQMAQWQGFGMGFGGDAIIIGNAGVAAEFDLEAPALPPAVTRERIGE